MEGYEIRLKHQNANSILTGYYCSYYTNGGKKAKDPNALIQKLFAKKQSIGDGLSQIEKFKKLEQGGNNFEQ